MIEVVLVNEVDQAVGTMEKMQAHQEGLLHRAFSVFILNRKNELLLQQRALHKYHSGGLWTNTCCSHPLPDEPIEKAALRRLQEEMGLTCELDHAFHFIYRAALDGGLTEHELDHVFIGVTDVLPTLNTEEANDYSYVNLNEVERQISERPERFTAWFKIVFPRFREYAEKHFFNENSTLNT
jgi:isopentenyl-diphosphate Delta-isomerase